MHFCIDISSRNILFHFVCFLEMLLDNDNDGRLSEAKLSRVNNRKKDRNDCGLYGPLNANLHLFPLTFLACIIVTERGASLFIISKKVSLDRSRSRENLFFDGIFLRPL